MILRCDIVEQLAIAAMLHNQKEPLRRFDDLIQLNDRRMPHDLQDVDFPRHSFNIINVVYLVFLQDFDCNLLPCENMESLFDLAKRALSERPLNLVVPYHLRVVDYLGLCSWHFNMRDSATFVNLLQVLLAATN